MPSIFLLVSVLLVQSYGWVANRTQDAYFEEAVRLQKAHPLFDGHNDLPWAYRSTVYDNVYEIDLMKPEADWHTDIPRLRAGEVGANFWSVYVSCGFQAKDAVRATLEQIDVVYLLEKKYPHVFRVTKTSAEVEAAFRDGLISSLMGMEGGHQIDSSFGALRQMYNLGVRYMTLTHTCNNAIGDSSANGCADDYDCREGKCETLPSGDRECSLPQDTGLTQFGQQIVPEMNRMGMIVDLSHVSVKTMIDALELAKAPAIFSHSNARTLCNHTRNIPDEVLLMLKKNGGVAMVTFVGPFLKDTPPVTLDTVADHIDYIAKGRCPSWSVDCDKSGFPGIGVAHVGYGSDFDGTSALPTGLENPSRFPHLTAELLRRGYTATEVSMIFGLNTMRVLKEVERVKEEMKHVVPAQGLLFPERKCRSQL